MLNLALELRPRSLDAMVGMRDTASRIRTQMNTERIPSGWLFIGDYGTGKTTTARIIAVSLQCTHQPFGNPCVQCWQLYDSQAFAIQEHDCATNTSVEFIRTVAQQFRMMPPLGRYRVCILDEAHMLSNNAQSALLKHLEDIPDTTKLLIGTTNPLKIIEGIRDRCLAATYVMPTLDEGYIKELVVHTVTGAKSKKTSKEIDELVQSLKVSEITRPRVIVSLTELWLAGASIATCVATSLGGSANFVETAHAVLKGDWYKVADLLSSAKKDDGRVLRNYIATVLRNRLLLKPDTSPQKKQFAVDAINTLTEHATFEDGLQLSATAASLYTICKAFKGLPA